MIPKGLVTISKLEKISSLALKNSVQLHFDAIHLYINQSYASAFFMSVLALEEFGKSNATEDYAWNTKVSKNRLEESLEKKWLEGLFSHPKKQFLSIARDSFSYTNRFKSDINELKLENRKQQAIYVGVTRKNGKPNWRGIVTSPQSFTARDARQQISLLNDIFREVTFLIEHQGGFFDVEGKDDFMKFEVAGRIIKWKSRSGRKLNKHYFVDGRRLLP